MPPEETHEQEQQRIRKELAALTPERAEEVASAIAEQWSEDWGAVLELVIQKTGLARQDAYQFIMLRELAMIRHSLEKGIQPKYHDDCAACRSEKQFHELQREALVLTVKHLKEEHGDEWQS